MGVAKTEPEEKQSNIGSQKKLSVDFSCFKSHTMDYILAHNGLCFRYYLSQRANFIWKKIGTTFMQGVL